MTSSSLRSIGYDPASAMLEIEFRETGVYRFRLVPASVYRALMAASSKGRFFNERIRDRYPAERAD